MKVLMVCLGNICRSPMAEGIFRKTLEEFNCSGVEVDSCGTAAYHLGEPPDSRAQAECRKHGIDISGLKGRQFTKADFKRFDLIFTMDAQNDVNIRALTNNEADLQKVSMILKQIDPKENYEVPDPYYGGDSGFLHVYALLKEASIEIVKSIAKEQKNV